MLTLFRRLGCGYASLRRKHPDGMRRRLVPFDDWVATWQQPLTPTYYDYFLNGEVRKNPMFMPDSAASKVALDQAEYNHRPALAQMHRRAIPLQDHFADDQHLSVDLSSVSLRSTMAGAGNKSTRSDLQRLVLWGVACLVTMGVYFGVFILRADDAQTIVQLQPHPSYFHYQAPFIREYIKACIAKIDFLEQHSRQVLQQAAGSGGGSPPLKL